MKSNNYRSHVNKSLLNQFGGDLLQMIRLHKNNSLVPVPYSPQSRVGQSEKYFISYQNYEAIVNIPG